MVDGLWFMWFTVYALWLMVNGLGLLV